MKHTPPVLHRHPEITGAALPFVKSPSTQTALSFLVDMWIDFHAHFRQGEEAVAAYIQSHISMFCEGFVAMPNTLPPVSKPKGRNGKKAWSQTAYLRMLRQAGAQNLQVLVPLYLTGKTTPAMVRLALKLGFRWFKAYPPHGTTNSDAAAPLALYARNGVLKAIEKGNGMLLVHGEESVSIVGGKEVPIAYEDWFEKHHNAETLFYRNVMPAIRRKFRRLIIVCEHITTKEAVRFVKKSGPRTFATVCPQHLLYTVGYLLKNAALHLLCMPVVKFADDRRALIKAVTSSRNTQFFAGTDSAPHPEHDKNTPCGCAAGCFTAGYAPQLYVQAFEAAGLGMSLPRNQRIFNRFLATNGARCYGVKLSGRQFRLVKKPQKVVPVWNGRANIMPLPLGLNYSRPERSYRTAKVEWTALAA